MNAVWWLVLAVGVATGVVGVIALFRLKATGEHALKLGDSFEIKSNSAGWSLTVIGLLIVVYSAYQLTVSHLAVTDVALTTDGRSGTEFTARCPTSFPLEGVITIANGGGDVQYRLRSQESLDGAVVEGPVHTLTYSTAGTKTIRDQVLFTVPEGEVYRKIWLQVVSPDTTSSTPVEFRGVCDPTLPPGPTLPPPNVTPPS